MRYEIRHHGAAVGAITRSPDGAWYARISLPRAQRSIRARTLANAKRMAAETVQWHTAPQPGLLYVAPAPDGSVTFHKES